MKIKTFDKLNLKLYEHTLDNGFTIYVVPMQTKNIYATLSTKYGSIQNEFIPYGQDKMVKVPDGIAHFLEHKMFEQENGSDPFEFFASHGADANANTTNFKTTYLFSGPKYLKENLNYLFDYVYSPYFTDANVEKEKGIINQEIKMYEDNPYSLLYENIIANTFVNHPIKVKVIGDTNSVNSITKEDLYTCYNTFYQPSNMFLVVTGNVKPKEVISIVTKNMSKKKFNKQEKIVTKKYEEPNNVAKKSETFNMDINVPKVGLGYKLNIKNIKMNPRKVYTYLALYFDMQMGCTSLLNEELSNKGIINSDLEMTNIKVDDFVCFYILSETNKSKTLIKMVDEVIKSKKIDKKDFDRKKNMLIADLIKTSDNIYLMNNTIMNNVVRTGSVYTRQYEFINKLSYAEFKKVICNIDFNNSLTYIIKNN